MQSTTDFIAIVKQQEAIYDTTNTDYKNMERKSIAWKNVAENADLSVGKRKKSKICLTLINNINSICDHSQNSHVVFCFEFQNNNNQPLSCCFLSIIIIIRMFM